MRHDRRSVRIRTLALVAAAAVLLAALYVGGRWLEKQEERPEARGDYTLRQAHIPTVEVDGITYRQRQNVTSILLMGVDQPSEAKQSGYRSGGQADFLRLLVIDGNAKTVSQLQIDRDTMTPITILGVLGNQSGTRTAQISLSHGYGATAEQSGKLTQSAVSNLLFGVPIDFYMALNLDGISELNDAVGGVTVTLADDFSALDAAMLPGVTLTLQGEQAEYYVRSRMSMAIGTNEARMARQEEYISSLTEKIMGRVQDNANFVGEIFDQLTPYLSTDISRGRLINEVWAARDYERKPLYRPEGTHRVAEDGFMQFQADEADLERIVLEMFYEKVK